MNQESSNAFDWKYKLQNFRTLVKCSQYENVTGLPDFQGLARFYRTQSFSLSHPTTLAEDKHF